MQRYSRFGLPFLLIGLSALLLQACRQERTPVHAIPAQANFVVALNLPAIALKHPDLQLLAQLPWIRQKLHGKEDQLAEHILHSGVDVSGTAYVFSCRVEPAAQKGFFALLPLSDAAQFGDFLQKNRGRVESGSGGIKLCHRDSMVIGWSSTFALLAFTAEADTGEEQLLALFNTDPKASLIETNDYFQDLLEEEYDAMCWTGLNLPDQEGLPLPPGGLLSGSFAGALLHFENGALVVDGKLKTNNDALKKYPDLLRTKVEPQLWQHVPTATPLAVFAAKVNMPALVSLMRDNNLLPLANQRVQMLGMTAEQVMDMLSGDVAVSVVKAPDSARQVPQMCVTLGIHNSESLRKLISNFRNQGFLIRQKDYLGLSLDSNVAFIQRPNQLIFVTTPALRDKVLAGSGESLGSATTEALGKGAMSFYFDYDPLRTQPSASTLSETKVLGESVEALKVNLLQTSRSAVDVSMVLTFRNKTQNSLLSLLQLNRDIDSVRRQKTVMSRADSTRTSE